MSSKLRFGKSHFLCGLAVVATIVAAQAASAEASAFNLKDDFSTTENPHGVWSYNVDGSPISQTISGDLGTGWGYASNWDGCIIQAANISGGVLDIGSGNDWAEGDIIVHVNSFGSDNSITWTSPSAGTIAISGRAWDAAFASDRDAEWSLSVNDDVVATRSTIYGTHRTDAEAAFDNNLVSGKSLSSILVASGDIVTFTPHATTTYGHFLGVDMTVDLTSSLLPGDANGDGKVEFNDLSRVLTNYDKTGMVWAQGDFNGDGKVDLNDLSKVLTNYDKTAGASAAGINAVPEPCMLVLLVAGLAGLLAYASRKRRTA